MSATVPVPSKSPGDVLTSSLWNTYVAANINKLLNQGHRVLTVSAFNALSGLEDGDEVYLEVDGTNGIQWHLRYHLSSTKWRVLGGPPMYSEIATSETTTSSSYADLSTVGPSLVAPLAGVYDIGGGAAVFGNSTGGDTYMAAKLGSASTADTETLSHGGVGGGASGDGAAGPMARTLAASDTVKAQYKAASGTATFANRRLTLGPRRIG